MSEPYKAGYMEAVDQIAHLTTRIAVLEAALRDLMTGLDESTPWFDRPSASEVAQRVMQARATLVPETEERCGGLG